MEVEVLDYQDRLAVTFSLYPLRFRFRARDTLAFPANGAGNVLRGALGSALRRSVCRPECPGFHGAPATACPHAETCAYARLWEPAGRAGGPTGFTFPPRPFVLRAGPLDGCRFEPGTEFALDLHLFQIGPEARPAVAALSAAFASFATEGIGPLRARAELTGCVRIDAPGDDDAPFASAPLTLSLAPAAEPVTRILVAFRTPTEWKAGGQIAAEPDFASLFRRVRDRIATLSALYGEGVLEADFSGLATRARGIELLRHSLQHVARRRRSSRTGIVHPLGGFTGEAEYGGDLREFTPWLKAAQWTHVGRQTMWGNGEIRVYTLPPESPHIPELHHI